MINAVISGQARTALLIEGDTLLSFHIDSPEILKRRKESDFRYIFGEATDLRFLQDTQKDKVLVELKVDYIKTCSLDLALMLLDEDISESKPFIAEALEQLLADENIIVYLESVFYAKPLPRSADPDNALNSCKDSFFTTHKWLADLINNQERIVLVRNIWDGIATDVFGDEEKRKEFESVLVQQGIFRQLVLNCGNAAKIGSLNFVVATNKQITSLPNFRAVLQALFAPLKQSTVSTEDKRQLKDEEEETFSRRQKRRQKFNREEVKFNREEVKNNVQSQIDYITEALKKRDLASAHKLTDELINYQTVNGEPIHLVKSLCQIAKNAKEFGFYQFQLELTEKAVDKLYSDAWTQAQYADALLQNNKFEDALKTYKIALSFSFNRDTETEIVTRNGYAEVLKAQGKLGEALEVYQEALKAYPENIVAKTGYAEVLKAQGKLSEALEIYQEALKSHPENNVARNGYAEVLKAQGKLSEALGIYQEALKSYPEDIVTRNGYAEVLKEQGKLGEALEVYQEALKSHPENIVAKTGYAEVLKAQGKLSEASEIYQEALKSHPENIVARNGYAEVLKAQGKLGEALEIYQEALKSYPEDTVARNGYAMVLFSLGKYDESLKNLPADNLITHSDWVGYHIRGMIMLKTENLVEAIKIFEKGMKEDPIPSSREYSRSALAIARLKKREFNQVNELLEEVTSPVLQPAVNLLRVHAFGELGMFAQAADAFQDYKNAPLINTFAGYKRQSTLDLVAEVNSRYVTSRVHNLSDDWLIDREQELLLALAP